jgi:hypothetical protein
MVWPPETAPFQQEIDGDLSRLRELPDIKIHMFITAREILKVPWGVIALKPRHSKSTFKSASKKQATFHHFRGK